VGIIRLIKPIIYYWCKSLHKHLKWN